MGILNEPQEIEEQEKCECGCEEYYVIMLYRKCVKCGKLRPSNDWLLEFLNDNGKPENHEYIGDGVYVTMDDHDTILLATERENGIHFIFLEPREMRNLMAYVQSKQETDQLHLGVDHGLCCRVAHGVEVERGALEGEQTMRTKRYMTDDQKNEIVKGLGRASNPQDKLKALDNAIDALVAEGRLDDVISKVRSLVRRKPMTPDSDTVDADVDLIGVLARPRKFRVKAMVAFTNDGLEADEYSPAEEEGIAPNCWDVYYTSGDSDNEDRYDFIGTFLSEEKAQVIAQKLQELNELLSDID